jgi:hypothetical protein
MTWISVAGRRVGWVSIGGITVTRIPVARKISIGWVAVIGARWRWRSARDTSKNSGCPSDRRPQGGSWPATRCRSNRSTGSRSPKPTGKTALDGIIGVCARRQAQHQSGDYAGRNSGHTAFPQVVDRVQPTSARRIFAPFLATNPGMCPENPGQAATGKRAPAASLVLRFHDAQDVPQAEREQSSATQKERKPDSSHPRTGSSNPVPSSGESLKLDHRDPASGDRRQRLSNGSA